MTAIPVGMCQCGCGQPTTRLVRSRGRGTIGTWNRYAPNHNGLRIGDGKHYRATADGSGKVRDVHRVIAERALGKRLPRKVEVHHVDGNKLNNANRNLVICEDHAYHRLLHMRTKVVRAGGNPNVDVFCNGCQKAKAPSEFSPYPKHVNGLASRCKRCLAAEAKARSTPKQAAADRYWHAVEKLRRADHVEGAPLGYVAIPEEAMQ